VRLSSKVTKGQPAISGETIATGPYSRAAYIARTERPLQRPTAANQSAPRRSIGDRPAGARERRDDEHGRGNRVADDDDGYRVRPPSTLLFWCLAPFFVDPRNGNLKAVIWFACVGLFFPGAAALLNFESNRLMGPNIAGALSSMTPVFAVLLAIVILGERVRGPQLLGMAAIALAVRFRTMRK
jgi:hypothetical protein